MAVRRGRPAANKSAAAKAPVKRGRPATSRNSAGRTSKSAAKAPVKSKAKDVTEYATKPATDYHKAFARWAVQEVGYDPKSAKSASAAFLKGIQIATAARPAFMESEFLATWREQTGQAKRGPKPKNVEPPVDDEEEFEDEEVEDEDDDFEDEDSSEDEDDDDDFDDDDSEDDSEEDDDEFDDDESEDEDDEEEEEAPPPAPKRRTVAKSASVKTPRVTSNRSARGGSARKASRSSKANTGEEDLF